MRGSSGPDEVETLKRENVLDTSRKIQVITVIGPSACLAILRSLRMYIYNIFL